MDGVASDARVRPVATIAPAQFAGAVNNAANAPQIEAIECQTTVSVTSMLPRVAFEYGHT